MSTIQLKREDLIKILINDKITKSLPDQRQVSINEVPHSTLKRISKTDHRLQWKDHHVYDQHVLERRSADQQRNQGSIVGLCQRLHDMPLAQQLDSRHQD